MADAVLLAAQLQANYKATRDPDDALQNVEDTVVLAYDYQSDPIELVIEASEAEPVFLTGLSHLVTTAFAGGTPAINVGDGTTADKYLAAAAITEASVGNLAHAAVGAKFTSRAKIVVTLSASLSAGAGALIARLFRQKVA